MDTTIRSNSPSSTGFPGNSDGTLNKASGGAHAAVDSIANAADEAARKAKPAIDKAASMAHQAVDKAVGVAAPAADWIAEQGESLKATQKKLLADTCNYVSAHPLQSLGIAIAAGFLIGRVMR